MRRAVLLAALGLALSGCTYTYIPPVPEVRTAEPRLDIRNSPGLHAGPEGLRLSVRLNEVPQAGWLAVQWFGAENEQLASDSIWISPASEGTVQTLYLPEGIPVEDGDGMWRAVLSFEGRVLRQFTLEPDPVVSEGGGS